MEKRKSVRGRPHEVETREGGSGSVFSWSLSDSHLFVRSRDVNERVAWGEGRVVRRDKWRGKEGKVEQRGQQEEEEERDMEGTETDEGRTERERTNVNVATVNGVFETDFSQEGFLLSDVRKGL